VDGETDAAGAEEARRRAQTEFVAVAIRQAEEEEEARKAAAKRAGAAIEAVHRKEAESAREGARQRLAAERELSQQMAAIRAAELRENDRILAQQEDQRQATLRMVAAIRALTQEFETERQTVQDIGLMVEATLTKMAHDTEAYAGSWQQVKDVLGDVGGDVADFATVVGNTISGMLGDLRQLGDQRIAFLQEQAAAEVEAHVDAAEQWADAENQMIDAMEARGALSEQEAAAERKRVDQDLDAKLDAANKLKRDERQAAMETFRRNQALARVQAAIAAAISAVALIPSLSYLAWGAPIAAAGIAGAALATQMAVINSTPPPEFPTGLRPGSSPDHPRVVALQDGEPVLPRRAVAALGGPQAVDRLIAGQSAGAPAVHLYLGRKLLGQVVDSAPSRPMDPRAGRRDPRRR
jgi:hypothetical protein